jgi:hypothetical protein
MGIFTVIFLSFAVSAAVYFAARRALRAFAEAEIERHPLAVKRGSTLCIYAQAQSVEYLMRLAALASCEKTVIYIDKNSACAGEALYIAAALAKKMNNTEIRYYGEG